MPKQIQVFAVINLILMRQVLSDKFAICEMSSQNGAGGITGTISLSQSGKDDELTIKGVLKGEIEDGDHGFHIHQFGALGDDCGDAGGHFNPFAVTHGGPKDKTRHVGDLGNVKSKSNVINIDIEDKVASLFGENSVLNRSIVLHERKDDLGQGGDDDSRATGNAGPRLGCCIIFETSSSGRFDASKSNLLIAMTVVSFLHKLHQSQ